MRFPWFRQPVHDCHSCERQIDQLSKKMDDLLKQVKETREATDVQVSGIGAQLKDYIEQSSQLKLQVRETFQDLRTALDYDFGDSE